MPVVSDVGAQEARHTEAFALLDQSGIEMVPVHQVRVGVDHGHASLLVTCEPKPSDRPSR
jgi:hypothetical protein